MNLKKYAFQTNQGPYLQVNEDRVDIDLPKKLFLLLDAFGGSNIGDKAAEKISKNIIEFYGNFDGDPDATFPFFYSYKYLLEGNALINSMHYAHEVVREDNSKVSLSQRAGASCIAAAMSDSIITFASVGNCLVYLYRTGELKLISKPETFELIAGADHERQFCTAPTGGFGLFHDLHMSVTEVKVSDGDLFLLLSDGVYSRVGGKDIEFLLQKNSTLGNDSITDIFNLANSRGNLDNQSLLMLQF